MHQLSILHISDLHRDPGNEVSNSALLLSLIRDRDRYRNESPKILDPNLIIVSGDIVHGVKYDLPDAETELKSQYGKAEEFLIELANEFVEGDRERVVIIPGNHDVSFFHAHKSMNRIQVNLSDTKGLAEATSLAKRMWAETNPLRWSWGDFSFYEVTDRPMYARRLEAFSDFYASFYRGKRCYKLDSSDQFDIFDYPIHNTTVVAFCSCHENDPRNKKGEIHPEAFSKACLELRNPRYAGRLLLATWHHNTRGGPMQSDYMDQEILQLMIDFGFSIGFHGHQHRAQFIEEKYQFGTQNRMVVISSGTLCAGPSEIPSGELRAYNILELSSSTFTATLHQRRMQNQTFGNVIWGPGRFAITNDSSIAFGVQPPPARQTKTDLISNVSQAEKLMRDRKFDVAAALLYPIASANSLAKKLLWECYVELGDEVSILSMFYPPSSLAEIVHIADILWATDKLKLKELLELELVRASSDPTIIALKNTYEKKLSQ